MAPVGFHVLLCLLHLLLLIPDVFDLSPNELPELESDLGNLIVPLRFLNDGLLRVLCTD